MTGTTRSATVVGAGIVGVATAIALQRAGFAVTLVDRQAPGQATSFGNAGILSGTTAMPLATPGILAQVPKMLLDPLGPLTIRWSYLPQIAPWLVRFVRNAQPELCHGIIRSNLCSLFETGNCSRKGVQLYIGDTQSDQCLE